MENVTFENVQELLNGGKNPKEVFDYLWDFQEGFAPVLLNGKYNLIDKNGNLLSPNQWFDICGDFHEGFAGVKLNGKWNYIDENGKILSPNQWFDFTWDFYDGFARVWFNGKNNYYLDKNGKLTTEKENKKDMEENKEKKMLYIVLSDNMYIDCFTNAEEALDCVVKKQNTGQISVVKKLV